MHFVVKIQVSQHLIYLLRFDNFILFWGCDHDILERKVQ